ncbi:hypothetical protein NHQ30_011306 [Ciborinia camelliae]|nr:hypothetical protein NHQ30_011306 [Ciborinia camelliae]
MYTVGSIIQQLNKYDKVQTLDSLLKQEREEVTSFLQSVYTSLSTESKGIVQEISRKTNGTKRKKPKSLALVSILRVHDIAVPSGIQEQFQIWKENPSRFWRPLDSQLSEPSIETAAIEAYLVLQRLRVREVGDVILWRFYVSFFYELALLVGHGQKVMTLTLHNTLYERLLKATTQSKEITDEPGVMKTYLQAWVAAGSRYNKICMSLDKGALFLIPQIPDDMWENPNSLKGAEFDEAMSHLQREGITKLSNQLGADILATQILNSALEPFRWNNILAPMANSSSEPKTIPPSSALPPPSSEPKTIPPSSALPPPSSEPKTIPPSSALPPPSSEPKIIRFTPNPISALLNPLEDPTPVPSSPSKALMPLGNSFRKRKREDSISFPDAEFAVLGLCPVNQLKKIFDHRLFDAMMQSRKASQRYVDGMTDAICVHAPRNCMKSQFIVQLWLCSSMGKEILDSTIGCVEKLRGLLAFEGMEKDSLCRREELKGEKSRGISAVKVSFNDENDAVVEIMVDLQFGQYLMSMLGQVGTQNPNFSLPV